MRPIRVSALQCAAVKESARRFWRQKTPAPIPVQRKSAKRRAGRSRRACQADGREEGGARCAYPGVFAPRSPYRRREYPGGVPQI